MKIKENKGTAKGENMGTSHVEKRESKPYWETESGWDTAGNCLKCGEAGRCHHKHPKVEFPAIDLLSIFRKEIHRTNERGSCLWCGRKLRPETTLVMNDKLNLDTGHTGYRNEKTGNYGGYGDNAFCGLRCGYSFGVAAAKNDSRLNPYNGKA